MVFSKLREAKGVSPVALIAILFLLASLSYAFVSLIAAKHMAFPMAYHSNKAFYITEGGIQYTAKYLRGYGDWSSVPNIGTTQFGGGSFQVSFSNLAASSASATITGTFGSAERVVSLLFSKSFSSLLSQYAVSGVSVTLKNSAHVDSYIEDITESDAPRVELPGGHEYSALIIKNSEVLTLAPGTYYFSSVTIKNSGVVNISPDGPVTIWLEGKFEMKNSASFNYGGDAANLLILPASTGSPGVSIKNSARFKGAIYAPEANVDLKNSMNVHGAIVGNNVQVKNSAAVTHDPDAGINCDGYNSTGTLTISDAGWGEEIS